MAPPVLAGRLCTLRGLTIADAPSIARHADDEGVWQNLFEGFPRPYTLEDARAWCGAVHKQPEYGHLWAIEAESQAIGCCAVRPDSGWLRCNAEVGYWIGREFWGRGIASEALGLISAWAWTALPELTRLYAPIYDFNAGSQAVARRCGYVLEGRFPRSAIKGGRVIGRVQYGLYRPSQDTRLAP